MQPERLPYSQQSASYPYTEPQESNPHPAHHPHNTFSYESFKV